MEMHEGKKNGVVQFGALPSAVSCPNLLRAIEGGKHDVDVFSYPHVLIQQGLATSGREPSGVLEMIAPLSHGLATTSGVLVTIPEVLATIPEVLASTPEDLARPTEVVRPVSEVLAWVRGIGRACLRAPREELPDSRSLSRWASRAAFE